MAWIELKPEGAGPIRAWRADPSGKPKGGIVVIQEIFGVNSHIRAVTDRFAAEGYLAVAPAIFEHIEPKFETGYDGREREHAAWRSPASSIASRCCATSSPRSRSPRKAARSVSSAIASAARSPGRRRPRFGPQRRGRLLWRRDHRPQGLEAEGPDASPFRREGRAHPDFGGEGRRRSPSRTSRSTSTRPTTASIATSGTATTRRAPRSPGRGRWRS